MRDFDIDAYLADLCVLIDDLGGRANLVGLCQGGWLSLMFAARFHKKVAALVLAGSPIDLNAGRSEIAGALRALPTEAFESLVASGDGLVFGRRMLTFWGVSELEAGAVADVLQIAEPAEELVDRFTRWHRWTVDLPGRFYLRVVEDLFRHNALAKGHFRALGRTLDLRTINSPLQLLAADADEVTPAEQLFAAAGLVGTAPRRIRKVVATGTHLSLFMGGRTLRTEWRAIASRLQRTSARQAS